MSKNTSTISLYPARGGITVDGHPTMHHPRAYKGMTNWIVRKDGVLERRGGQRNINRVAIREGVAFGDHFTRDALSEDKWPTGDRTFANSYSFYRSGPSVFRFTIPGTASASSAQFLNATDFSPRILVQSADSLDPNQTETISIQFIMRIYSLSSTAGQNSFQLQWRPGAQEDPDVGEMDFFVSFESDGIYVVNDAGSEQKIDSHSTIVDEAGIGDSKYLLWDDPGNVPTDVDSSVGHSGFHTFRFDVTRTSASGGNNRYRASLYFDDLLTYSGIQVSSSDAAGTALTPTLTIKFASPSGGDDVDIELDSIDLDAQAQPIRSLFEYRQEDDGVENRPSQTAIYAGSRVLLDIGDTLRYRCVDEDLPFGLRASFVSFRGDLIYTTQGADPIRIWEPDVGLTRSLKGDAPVAGMLQVHANRVWAAGNPDFPSRAYFSDILDADTWNVVQANLGESGALPAEGGYIDVDPDDGDRITALGPSFQQSMPTYKNTSVHRIVGTSSADFARGVVTRKFGAVSHFAVANIGRDQYFVSEVGVHSLLTTDKYGDVEESFLSDDIRDFWNESVNTGLLKDAWAVDNENEDRFEILLPVREANVSIPNRILGLHYGAISEEHPFGMWYKTKISGYSMLARREPQSTYKRVIVGLANGHLALQDMPSQLDFPVYDKNSITIATAVPAAATDDLQVNLTSDSVVLTAGNLSFGKTSAAVRSGSAIRFTSLAVPAKAPIAKAVMVLDATASDSNPYVNVKIQGESNVSPATFSDYTDWAGRTRTTAYVLWYNVPAFSNATLVTTVDISAIVQEIVNLAGWASGNDLVIFIDDDNSRIFANNADPQRLFAPQDHGTGDDPQLVVYYWDS